MATSSTATTSGGEKKRPGRPKKHPVYVNLGSGSGLSKDPQNKDTVVELVYVNPGMFKKIFQLFKSFGTNEIDMSFDATGASFSAIDHFEKSNIFVRINGNRMNHYFCKTPTRITVQRTNIEKILSTLGKSNTKISLILRSDFRSVLYIIIYDSEYNSEDTYDIDIGSKSGEEIIPTDDKSYPISFKINSKHLKMKITHIRKISPVLTIQKSGAEPLQLTFDRAQSINWTSVYNDANKIMLHCDINPDDVFSVSVDIDHILPLCNLCAGEDVLFRVDKKDRLSLSSFLDGADGDCGAIISVFTEIRGSASLAPRSLISH